jgi:hypothetical protein
MIEDLVPPIGNHQQRILLRSFLRSFARGLQRTTLVAFTQLAGTAAVKGPFVGAVSRSAIPWQDTLDFAVGAGYHVNTD